MAEQIVGWMISANLLLLWIGYMRLLRRIETLEKTR